VVTLDKEESARWRQAVSSVIDAYAKDLDAKGLEGAAVVNTIRQAMQQYLHTHQVNVGCGLAPQ
jgi:hypothetical protein